MVQVSKQTIIKLLHIYVNFMIFKYQRAVLLNIVKGWVEKCHLIITLAIKNDL